VIERFSERAGDTVRWLQGMGVRFDFLPTQSKSQPRLPPASAARAGRGAAARAESSA
jgi:tricarballylate dehydrogenase